MGPFLFATIVMNIYTSRDLVQGGGDYSICSVCNLKTGSPELFCPNRKKNVYFKDRYMYEAITRKTTFEKNNCFSELLPRPFII